MRVFRRRSAGATDGTAQDSPGAQSPDGPADSKPRSSAEAAKGRPTPKRSEAEAKRRAEARAREHGRKVAAAVTDPFAVLYQTLLATGQRCNEMARARWSEIDAGMLTVPAERMKGKKAHVVPLTHAVRALLG